MGSLESGALRLEGEACLEFWYLEPLAANGSELRALLKGSTGQTEIWTSPALDGGAWRQVFVPLTISDAATKVTYTYSCFTKTNPWTLRISILLTIEPLNLIQSMEAVLSGERASEKTHNCI